MSKRLSSNLNELLDMCEYDVHLCCLRGTKPVPEDIKDVPEPTYDSIIVGVQCESKGGIYGVPQTIQTVQEWKIISRNNQC